MKSYIRTITLFMGILSGWSIFAQKQTLTPEAYREWKRIDSPDMSSDGKWVIYRVVHNDRSVLYLHETATQKTISIPQAETAFFWGRGKWLCYYTKDSTILLNLQTRKKQEWNKTKVFQPVGETEWVTQSYTVDSDSDSSFTRLVLHHISRQDSLLFDHIGYYTFYNNDRCMVYIREKPHQKTICYGKPEGPHRILFTLSGMELKNFHLDKDSGKGYFFTYPHSLIYSFDLKHNHIEQLFDLKKIPVPTDSVIRNIRLSKNQEYLTYELHPRKGSISSSPKKSSAAPTEIQVWGWNNPVLPGHQVSKNKPSPTPYAQYVYHLSNRTSFCFDPTGQRQILPPPGLASHSFITIDKTPYLKDRERKENIPFDAYLVDSRNGKSIPVMQNLTELPVYSPDGRYTLFYCADRKTWYSLNNATSLTTDVSSAIGFPMYDEKHDLPCAAPSYGIAGWSEQGNQVGIYDRYDLWIVDLDHPQKTYSLTKGYGRRNQKIIRLCQVNFVPEKLKLRDNNRVKILDERNKQEGVYLLSPSGKLKKLIEGPYSLRLLKMAADGKYCLFNRQNYTEYRNLWWSRTDFSHPQQLTDVNPQQKKYNWGTVRLVEWTNYEGKENKGLLYLPENYHPSNSYPTLVQFYETHSQDLFVYHTPGLSAALADIPTFVSNGYIVFMPDIHFSIGHPGESCYNAVVSGVNMLIEQGIADPHRIGLQGHSWSGFQAAYLVTRTSLFSCANIGAPVTDMPAAYTGIRNGSGRPRFFMYEDTQSRMGKTLWEAREAYLANSPLLYADRIITPLLIFHNDADEAVAFEQGRALFLAMRRLQKPAWLINYKGEGHFLSTPTAREDWTLRMQQFFDHYLKKTPLPDWMKGHPNF